MLILDHFMNVTVPETQFLIFMLSYLHLACYLNLSVIFMSAVVITETIQVAVPFKP